MSAQVALRAYLNDLLDNAAKDRADEAPEAWANLEKLVRSGSPIPLSPKHLILVIQQPPVPSCIHANDVNSPLL